MENNLVKFTQYFTDELAKDKSEGSYYHAWQSAIAMAFQDEFHTMYPESEDLSNSRSNIHVISNNAAKRFLDQMIGFNKIESNSEQRQ